MGKQYHQSTKHGPARKMKRGERTADQSVHHILFPENKWSGEWATKLRDLPCCQVKLPYRVAHTQLHQAASGVACPDELACQRIYLALMNMSAYETLRMMRAPLDGKLRVLIPIFSRYNPDSVDGLYEQLSTV